MVREGRFRTAGTRPPKEGEGSMRQSVRSASVQAVAIAVLAALVAGSAQAGVVARHYDFAEPVITHADGYDRVTMEGAWSYGAPGEPVLPMFGARLLLPPGEEISAVRVTPGDRVVLGEGYVPEPGQKQYPLSFVGPVERFEGDYEGVEIFPARRYDEPRTGYYRGYAIATIVLRPVEYLPEGGVVAYYKSMDVEIETTASTEAMQVSRSMIRHDDATLARLARLVDNPFDGYQYESVQRTRSRSSRLDPDLGYKYIIITTDAWDDYLGDLVTFETNRGHKAGIFLRSWIDANYSGNDDQDQIRNFIIDAYDTWDIDYVLLVGDALDANGIPHRALYAEAYGTTDSDIPGDIYYGALDGTWNLDGDGYYGEIPPNAPDDEADLYPEVGVGRFCVDDVSEVQNMVTKTLRYAGSPIVSECDEALMAGELLWSSPLTYGGDYKDQIKDGSSANGYTTVGFPPTMNVDTLYDRDYTWSASEIIDRMENGLNIVNHLGHCGVTYALKMYTSDIPSFDNDGTNHTLNFVYSQGCYCGSFDNRDDYGSYGSDCFAEEFSSDDDGAVAIIMNSRYGWGDPGGTNGSSQYFDREFFDAMFAENIYPLADVNDDSKMDVIWAITYGANRWCYYELNVFGDPAMHLWTGEPTALTVNHPAAIMVGQPDMDVTVTSGGSPVEGATVTIWTDDYSVYDVGVTDGAGLATVHPNASDVGTLHIKVTAHDHLDYDADIPINPASGPYVAFESYTVDDDQAGESNGNGDLVVNAGETIELIVTLENVGVDTAYGVNAVLSTTSGRITLNDDYEEYGDIAPSGTATCADDYDFAVAPDTPDGEVIPFTLTIKGVARETWESNFSIVVSSPDVAYASHDAQDPLYSGNGNGCLEAGETVQITLSLTNSGSADATCVVATLSTADPYVIVYENTASIATLASGSTDALSPDYTIALLPSCPETHEILFDVAISADWGYSSSGQFIITTAGQFADDVESGEGEWVHYNVTGGFVDQWHVETYRYHSAGHSWKFGGAGSNDYSDSSDGALEMRPVCVGSNGQLSFWHWMDAEEESSTSAWDCGLLEISTDGGATWDILYPDAGYTHEKNYNPANPLPEGTPCWSGSFSWRQETCDLSAYEGETVQIRWRFASDGYVTEEGWYVDDINLTFDVGTSVDEELLPIEFALGQNAPNPFNPVTVIQYQLPEPAHVRIDVYNIAGRRVRTIVDGPQEAGYQTVVWDGTNDFGQKVASGVYMYRMQAGDFVSEKRMVLLK